MTIETHKVWPMMCEDVSQPAKVASRHFTNIDFESIPVVSHLWALGSQALPMP